MSQGMNNPATVDSTSAARTVNNVMRHEYRVLSDLEKAHMKETKDLGAEFYIRLLEIARDTCPDGVTFTRELEIAQQRIEEAVMWAVKHITR